jgi:hypothetical protein
LPTIALGCATPLPEDPEQWPATQLKPGSVFYLNRDISIEPRLLDIGPGTVHFQGGRIMAQPHLDRYETYCLFLLNQTAAKPVLLESDAFIVTAVNSGLERSQRLEDNPIRLAANGNLSGLMLAEQRGLDTVSVRFRLRSDDQGEGYELTCRARQDPRSINTLTVAELRSVLGEYFTVQMVEPTSPSNSVLEPEPEPEPQSSSSSGLLHRIPWADPSVSTSSRSRSSNGPPQSS